MKNEESKKWSFKRLVYPIWMIFSVHAITTSILAFIILVGGIIQDQLKDPVQADRLLCYLGLSCDLFRSVAELLVAWGWVSIGFFFSPLPTLLPAIMAFLGSPTNLWLIVLGAISVFYIFWYKQYATPHRKKARFFIMHVVAYWLVLFAAFFVGMFFLNGG